MGQFRWVLLFSALGAACLPNPQSVKQRRQAFDRAPLLGRLILPTAPPGMKPVGAVFDGRAKLLGYEIDPERPGPGDRVKLRFYWSATLPMAEDYMVFIHGDAVGGKSGRLHADHFPAEGRYPTDVWQEGEVVVDPFTVWIPPRYGPKRLGIYTGLYKGNHRVPISNGGSRPKTSDNRSQALEIVFP